MPEEVNETFRHCRKSGIAYSVTLISLSTGLIVWSNATIADAAAASRSCQLCLAVAVLLLACTTVICCLGIQLFNYLGYKHQAQALFGQSTPAEAIRWFDREDWAVKIVTATFLLSVLAASVLYLEGV